MLLEHFLRISSDDCKQISKYLIGLCECVCGERMRFWVNIVRVRENQIMLWRVNGNIELEVGPSQR